MSAGRVVLERKGEVAHVTFDRPEARNAMTWEMYEQLSVVLRDLEAAEDLRVVVFRGAGDRAFVAGTDISQFAGFKTADDGLAYEKLINDIVGRVESLRIPTVAVIQGYATGGGLAIASVCDLRICTPDAKFGLPIAKTVGNCLSMKNYAYLVALLGPSRTKAMIFTAEFLSADDAQSAGFVMQVVPAAELEQRIDALCSTLIRNAPITLRVTKEAVRRIVARMVPDGDDLMRETYGSDDFREGVAAFMEKRPAVWKDR
jgi:enoyl-CoA hydratase